MSQISEVRANSLAEIEQLYESAESEISDKLSSVSNPSTENEKHLEILKLTDEQLQDIFNKSMKKAISESIREIMKNNASVIDDDSVLSEGHMEHLVQHKKSEFKKESINLLKGGVSGIISGALIAGSAALIDHFSNEGVSVERQSHTISSGLYGVSATSIIGGSTAVGRSLYRFVTGHKLSEQVVSELEKVNETIIDSTKNKMITRV